MSTGPREGNIIDVSEDDSHLPADSPMSENLSANVESVREEIEWSQLDPDDGDVFEVPGVEQSFNDDDGNKERTELTLPSTSSTSAIRTKKRKNVNDFAGLLSRSMRQREERERQRAEDRKKLLLEEDKTANEPLFNFFKSMYQSTKNMPLQYQHLVRSQVFQAVSNAEADVMKIATTDKEPQILPNITTVQPNSSASLTDYINNYQCDN